MSRFLGGFFSASALWAAFVYALVTGLVEIPLASRAPATDAGVEPDDESTTDKASRRSKYKRRGRARGSRGQGFAGDDLGGPDERELALGAAGGEEQLRSDEIDAQFDAIFPELRRCLFLAAADEPVTGKLVFGLRVSGSGGVTKVNLRGPSAITDSEAGSCMRRAAHGMRLRSFQGPDMLVHLPMTLE